MKNWVIKLLVALTASIAISLLATVIAHTFHLAFWTRMISVLGGFIIAMLVMFAFQISKNSKILFLLSILPGAATIIAHNWLFYSADEIVEYANLEEAAKAEDKALYFTLSNYYYDTEGAGDLQITTTRKRRRGGKSVTKKVYTAIPLFTDSLSQTAEGWLIYDTSADNYHQAETYEDLLKFEDILCFERYTEELEDFKSAIEYSSYKDKTVEDPVFLYPLYKEFIPTHTWRKYFSLFYVGSGTIFILIGVILNYRQRKKEEEHE